MKQKLPENKNIKNKKGICKSAKLHICAEVVIIVIVVAAVPM